MNKMPFEWYLAARYFRSRRGSRYISLVSLISLIGTLVGTAALIITLSVLNGFEKVVTRRVLAFIPQLTITVPAGEPVPEVPGSVERFRYLEGKVLFKARENYQVVQLEGVDKPLWPAAAEARAGVLEYYGSDSLLNQDGLPGVIIGSQLAEEATLTIGDTIALVVPVPGPVAFSRPRVRHAVIRGIFHSNVFDYDRRRVYLHFRQARRLLGSGGKLQWVVNLKNYEAAPNVAARLRAQHPDWTIHSWRDTHRTLFSAMKMEKWGSFVGLSLIILVAAFNIVSTFMMDVLEKTPSIGILKIIGATHQSVARVFLLQGIWLGLLGISAGTAVGVGLVLAQEYWGFIHLPQDIYFIRNLPMVLNWLEVLLVVAVGFTLVLLSAWYPARQAARLKPVAALSYKE